MNKGTSILSTLAALILLGCTWFFYPSILVRVASVVVSLFLAIASFKFASKGASLFLLVAILAPLCYLCFVYTPIVVRIVSFTASAVLIIVAYCFIEHAISFRGWRTAQGKRRTPPGESLVIGVIGLTAAAFFIYCGIRRQ